ncbi:alpha-L-rhamnosidase [Agromyces sp. CF514]|uniref:alpha-L-rhamnosidase n=1 Tax=Agromyces sp. CF514 TaxID=1881031 RepID=UPI002101D447|nr:alpha-L-rhamnosidase [Agromyces sp. CF514]
MLTAAVLRATALGVCEVFLNGSPVSADVLTPGWSSYEWRLRYARWDVTPLIAATNTIGILVGNGWYAGNLGFAGGHAIYGDRRAALVQLDLTYADGFIETIVSDESWSSGPSAILADDLYDGQTIDGRAVDPEWATDHGSEDGWGGVRVVDFDHAVLTPYVGPPVRRQESMEPTAVWTSPSGRTLIDFGQNLAGWIRLEVTGDAGRQITIRHAEVLEHEELGVRPLRNAEATDRFILSGGADVFEPTFTFHGFRYAEVDGWPGTHDELASAARAIVVHSELTRTGTFECSDPLLNRLHANVVWTMRGNFVDVPTDCPQRDERLGWTGDLSAFAPTAAYLFDVEAFLRDWLLDLAEEQRHADGVIPLVVPDNIKYDWLDETAAALHRGSRVMALWSDAACWVPWALWQAYGDRTVLEQQYDSMVAYARLVDSVVGTRGLLDEGHQFGDWLDPTAPPDAPLEAKADSSVVATACVYRSAVIAAEAAAALGRGDDAAEFGRLAGRIREAFTDAYVDGGRITSDATAVYALAIAFDLLEGDALDAAGSRLAELAEEAGFTVTTGFAGTPFILGALTKTGHLDVAYRLLLEQECPSWLYPVTMGATTTWERWDSMLPDGSINPGEMTSFNHYAFGAVADWMHTTVAGLSPLAPGYEQVLFAPRPGGGLTWAKGALETRHGRVAISWNVDGGRLAVDVEVPQGCRAVIRIPGRDDEAVGSGRHSRGVRFVD